MVNATCRYFVFFFSSRRRHTRCLSDWSSDVCSSDLLGQIDTGKLHGAVSVLQENLSGIVERFHFHIANRRSEERRVGKECRYRRQAYKYKKNSRHVTY